MKAIELLNQIETATRAYEAEKQASGLGAAILHRADPAHAWAKDHNSEIPSEAWLRANPETDLVAFAAANPCVR